MLFLINDTRVNVYKTQACSVSQGGSSSFVAGFINRLLEKKHRFGLIGNFGIEGGNTKCFPFKAGSNLGFLFKLAVFFITKRFSKSDLLYFHRPDHLALAWHSSSNKVLHLHGQPHTTINNGRSFIRKFIYNRLESIAIKHADLIIATDKITAVLYSSLYPSSKSRIKIIPTGINLSEFNPDSTVEIFPGIIENMFNLVYVGRLAYPKQVREIIESFVLAFAGNPQIHLWIAGSGPDEIGLKKIAANADCNANIHFTGQLSRAEVISLIHSSTAGILLSHNEGSPLVVKEFLACGKPAIVNDVGDLSDYVVHGRNGFMVNPQQPESVANAMMEIVLKAPQMKAACRESMLPYDDQIIYRQVLDTLLQVQTEK